ncbi:hypothetical protein RFI_20767 [Reticulomyxa filosa]|uniref:Uncharacterized protein n=1 Tax=Reticulomyxa filosa TaxID=46433 RepID=X6MSZ5_RETFI|nr:hypothetical protein RFI_20767 [Reticulomyxa filosa]|eukprot:ETO16572.1 hypothetical protein RFI_20767 [Reticulomyxa filosa]
MALNDYSKIEQKLNLENSNSLFETLSPLPFPLCYPQCLIYKDEIIICGGYKKNECYSYHIIKDQYKYICSYPDNIILNGHCVIKIEKNNYDLNDITLLSFGGEKDKEKYTFIMKYKSIWEDNNNNKIKHINEWIPFINNNNNDNNNNNNINIGLKPDNYAGVRAIISGSNNHLLFIVYPSRNFCIFDLNKYQIIKNGYLPINAYLFLSKKFTTFKDILFSLKNDGCFILV